MKITNNHGISLAIAVWLLYDEYDYNPDEKYISATSLMKSLRQIVLSRRVPIEDRELDVADLIASSYGTALHDSIEKAWKLGGKRALKTLGLPEIVWDNLVINPTPEQLAENPNILACYIEQRAVREIAGYKVGGKFDMILDGRLMDNKSTSVYAYMLGSKDDDYALQGGIYRWLNPDKVLDDHIFINFLFTDWQSSMAKQNPNYPRLRTQEHPVRMVSVSGVETYIRNKLKELERCIDLPQDQLPRCTDKELWRSEPKFKYYSDPAKANLPGAKSTKNFDTEVEAKQHCAAAGKGVVKTIPGEVKACPYCPAFAVCEQRKEYFL